MTKRLKNGIIKTDNRISTVLYWLSETAGEEEPMNLEQLKYFKEKNGYTFAQLAELSGVPQGTIQKIFNGETRTPRNKTVRALEFVMKSEQKNPASDGGADFEDEPLGYTYGREFGSSDLVCEPSTVYKAKPGGYTLDDYYAIPDNRRVELIDGVIYDMAAPSTIHQYIIMRLCSELYGYVEKNRGDCIVLPSPLDVQIDCDDRSMLEPDLVVVCDPSKRITRCIMGAPDLVVEVLSPSSTRMDTKIKLAKYASAGVREYWVIDPKRERVCVYWTPEEDMAAVYGPQDDVPVGIFGGEFYVPMSRIFEQIRLME